MMHTTFFGQAWPRSTHSSGMPFGFHEQADRYLAMPISADTPIPMGPCGTAHSPGKCVADLGRVTDGEGTVRPVCRRAHARLCSVFGSSALLCLRLPRLCSVFGSIDGTLLDTNYLHAAAWSEAFIPEGADPCQARRELGLCGSRPGLRASVSGLLFSCSCHVRGERAGGSRTGRSPAAVAAPEASLRRPAGSPMMLAAGNGSRGHRRWRYVVV